MRGNWWEDPAVRMDKRLRAEDRARRLRQALSKWLRGLLALYKGGRHE